MGGSAREGVAADFDYGEHRREGLPSAMNTVAAIDPRHAAGQRLRERVFRSATFIAATLVLALLGGVAVSLPAGARPPFAPLQLSFLLPAGWDPLTEQFRAPAPLYRTPVPSVR